jgi:hypothetical protein
MQASFTVEASHLVVMCQGKADLHSISGVLRSTKSLALRESRKCILIDTTSIDRPIQGIVQFLAGETVAALLPPPFRVALLGPKGPADESLLQLTATNRGANLHVSDNEQEALDWLLKRHRN